MQIQKIAVIGGSGKSGKYLVNQLLERGYRLKLLLRNPDKFKVKSPLIDIIEGDARDYHSVLKLAEGSDALISTLGQPQGESSIFSEAGRNVIKAILTCGFSRYIVVTGINVNSPFDKKDEKTLFATRWMYDNFPKGTIDRQIEYEYLVQSDVDWTLVRLPLIIQTNDKFPIDVSLENCAGENISATDLANFLIDQLKDDAYIRQSPFLSNV